MVTLKTILKAFIKLSFLLLLSFVLLQKVLHGFFQEIVDALIKVNGELLKVLEYRYV